MVTYEYLEKKILEPRRVPCTEEFTMCGLSPICAIMVA